MDGDCELRVQRIEIELDRQKISLIEREKCEVMLWDELRKINTSIIQVKTAIYTGAFVLLLQNMGIFEVLKLLIH